MKTIYSISSLNAESRTLLEQNFHSIQVEGEVSDFKCPASGHWYFILKDTKAQIRCAMFRNANYRLKYRPKNGEHVVVTATLSIYEPRGDYQLICTFLKPIGEGLLQIEFEELKQKLLAEGLFSKERKKPLPAKLQRIAVVSSQSGAALQDILHVLNRRAPFIEVRVYDSSVQGKEAAYQLNNAINSAINENSCQAIIIGRGGGSLEDLHAFNHEQLARTLAFCPIPTVSAVGHETDFTICDFVCDVRAPTPSAAAEILSPDIQHLLNNLVQIKQTLKQKIVNLLSLRQYKLNTLEKMLIRPDRQIQTMQQKLDYLQAELQKNCLYLLHNHKQKFRVLHNRLHQSNVNKLITIQQQHISQQKSQLNTSINRLLANAKTKLNHHQQNLNNLNPTAILARGYSITRQNHRIISSVKDIVPNSALHIELSDGMIETQIKENSANN